MQGRPQAGVPSGLRVADANAPAVGRRGGMGGAAGGGGSGVGTSAAAAVTGNTRKRLDDALDDAAPQGGACDDGGSATPRRGWGDKRMRTTEDIFASLRIDDAPMEG